jgi:hypothetical protein
MTSRSFRSMFLIFSWSADMFFASLNFLFTEATKWRDGLEGEGLEETRWRMAVWISSSTLGVPAYQREGRLLE